MSTRRRVSKDMGAERLLDMPLTTGRVAKGMLVFAPSGSFLHLANLEESVVWKFDLARTTKTTAAALAETFSPFGSAFVRAMAEPSSVSAAPVDVTKLPDPETPMPAIEGQTEFGMQTPDDHEYFLSKFGDMVGVVRVKRRKDGGWSASLQKSNVPRVLTKEAVRAGLMPPPGHSGLPASLESVVPAEFQYWKQAGDGAREMRDAFVEHGFLTDDTIKAVDGELRKVEVQYYLYEPDASQNATATKRETFADRVMKILPERFSGTGHSPMASDGDWIEELDKHDEAGVLAILSPPDRTASPREMVRAATTLKAADWLLEHTDTRSNRAAFAGRGVLFKLAHEPARVFVASFAPLGPTVQLLKDEAVKTIDFQGLSISIDRPAGYVQTGKDADGVDWSRTYLYDYGFFNGTKGGDGDELDVFVGPKADAPTAFVVTQKKDDGTFDEYKVFVGFGSERDALQAYAAHIPTKFFDGVASVPVGMVKGMLGLEPMALAKRVSSFVRKIQGISGDQLRQMVNAALSDAYPPEDNGNPCMVSCGMYCDDVYDDHAIFYKDGKTFSVDFTYADGVVTLSGEPTPVMRTYVPLGQTGATDPAPPLPNAKADMAAGNLAAGGALQPAVGGAKPKKKPTPAEKRELERVVKAVDVHKDGEEHYVLGIVLEPDIVDAQNDTYSAEEIRSAFEKFAEHFRNMGLMHKANVNEHVKILENYIAPCDFDLGETHIAKGTWLMGCRVVDPELWGAVKKGELTGFSIGGSAIRKPASQEV